MTELEQRQAVVDEAHSWLGTKFLHQAGIKGAGVDCAHLITEVYRACGLMPEITFPQYGPDFWRHAENPETHIVETAKKYFREIPASEAKAGDWFVLYIGRCWAHCGILVGGGFAIEAWPQHAHVLAINTKTEKLYTTHSKRFFTAWGKDGE